MEARRLLFGDSVALLRDSPFDCPPTNAAAFEAHPTPLPDFLRFDTLASQVPTITGPAAALAAGAKHSLTSIPALNSLPGAAASLFLDFDGHFDAVWGEESNISTPAFDQDGDPTTFSDVELATIETIWNYVSEDFAPFKINVTTIPPASFANRVGLRAAIGGDGSWLGGSYGGISYVDAFTNSVVNTAYVFSDNLGRGNAKFTAQAVSHEVGHAFGLDHQATYDSRGRLLQEYSRGPGDGRAPLMGNSYDATRGVWWVGPTSDSPTDLQDDLAIIARTANGFGFRPDEHGDSAGVATWLTSATGSVTSSGILHSLADVDYFAFTTAAATVSFTVTPPAVYGNLDARLELRNSAGTSVLAAAAPAGSFGATVTLAVPAGSYRIVVSSQGAAGDVGQYTLTGSFVPPAVPPLNPLSDTVAAPSQLTATPVSSSRVDLAWVDNSASETGFRVERSNNGGASWTTLATTSANATTFSVTGLNASANYAFRVRAVQGNSISTPTAAVTAKTLPALTRPAAPSKLQATSKQSDLVALVWKDRSAHESAFQIERSVNRGSTWEVLATVGANVTSYVDDAVAPRTVYSYRVRALNDSGLSNASNTLTVFTPAATPSRPVNLAGPDLSPFSASIATVELPFRAANASPLVASLDIRAIDTGTLYTVLPASATTVIEGLFAQPLDWLI